MRKIRKTTSLVSAVMVLVLTVLALSTATYAWFSADNVVSLSTISFNVDHDTSGDGDLRILWANNDGIFGIPVAKEDIFTPEGLAQLEGKISLEARANSMKPNQYGDFDKVAPTDDSAVAVLSPAMPSVAPTKGMSQHDFYTSLYNSNTSFRIEDGKIVEYYHSDPDQENVVAVCAEQILNRNIDTIYLYNVNEVFAQRVTVSFKVPGASDFQKALRCAVFVNGSLMGIMGASNKIYYGPIVKGANIKDNLNYVNSSLTYDSARPEESTGPAPGDSVHEGVQTSSFTFDVYDVVRVNLYFYLDGNYITNKKPYGYSFDVVDFKFIGEFIEKASTGDPYQ